MRDNAFSVHESWPRVGAAERRALREILFWGVTSECDARFLTDHLASSGIEFRPLLQRSWRQWNLDEERDYTRSSVS